MPSGGTCYRAVLPATSVDCSRESVRAFADGAMAIILPTYLLQLGYSPLEIGIVITSTLLGFALATLAVGFLAHHYSRRWLLSDACVLMAATGIGFALTYQYWSILIIASLGTLNPSSGDVSLCLVEDRAGFHLGQFNFSGDDDEMRAKHRQNICVILGRWVSRGSVYELNNEPVSRFAVHSKADMNSMLLAASLT
jgi:hypothetical protein